jgi:5-methylcytosine-specific restriction protein A
MPWKPKPHRPHPQYTRADPRPSAGDRGYGWRWQKARDSYLREHPLCVLCLSEGRTTAASVVDHRIPHRGSYELFWDPDNWQSLCKPHHDVKTGKGL